jgi:signal transduction histidine kinase
MNPFVMPHTTGDAKPEVADENSFPPEVSQVFVNSPAHNRSVPVSSTAASPVDERVRFETLLADLSATFVKIPASEVDRQIETGLRQVVEVLGLDRSGLGEISPDGQLVITHSYEVPGVPPSPRVIVDAQMPWYAEQVRLGRFLRLARLPDDLPTEAGREREYCLQSGLKSNLAIPLHIMGCLVGGIGFASFRSFRDWPDDLIQQLRLIGDIFTNALARKWADEALKRAEEALKLAEEQARKLRDELAHATRLELASQLTSSIAHEVNQPLCAIASNAETALDLLDSGDTEEVKLALKDICSDARRGSEVIGCIRSMVKKAEPSRIAHCFGSVIDEIAPLLRREAAARGVELRIDPDTNDVKVVCDRVQLQQVVLNLVLNAVEAVSVATVGPPVVRIRIWSEGNGARVSVEDSGVGLSPEDCERIFAPFFTTKSTGLGMGLTISRSLIAAHGGKLWATPRNEGGTTVQFQLPGMPKV